jgi:serine/threonine protein kinase
VSVLLFLFKEPAHGISTNTLVHECFLQQNQAGTTEGEGGGNFVTEQCTDSSTVSVERANYNRYWELLLVLGREVLMTLFKEYYCREEGKQWEESCGPSFLDSYIPDRFSQSQLKKEGIDSIRSGKCHEWDITLLSYLLLHSPGFVLGDASGKKAVKALRKERNIFAHKVWGCGQRSLTEEDFQSKWKNVSASLEVLIEILPGNQAEAWRSRMDSIAKEELDKSALERQAEMVKEMQREFAEIKAKQRNEFAEIKEMQRNASDKAHEAFRMAEAAMQVSFNQQGYVYQDRLPREVELSVNEERRRYQLLKHVGSGGKGTVFEAKLIDEDSDNGKLALKICGADESGRAEREAQVLKSLRHLNHDNIVKFFDSAFWDSRLVIIMEFIQGTALDEWLAQRWSPSDNGTGVTFPESWRIVKQLVEGMAKIHELRIAHRDLKPANLIFDEATLKLVIVDFGLSKQYNTNSTITDANCQLGTFLYMSPEQFKGDVREISFTSDVWAIGIVWHEILTGYTPFENFTKFEPDSRRGSKRRVLSKNDEREYTNEVFREGPRTLSKLNEDKVPSTIIDIIGKCLCLDKNDRYRDANELLNKIENSGMVSADSIKPPSDPSPFLSWSAIEVAEHVRSLGPKYADSANQIHAYGVNGSLILKMLEEKDPDLTASVEDDGLGFTNTLKVNVLRTSFRLPILPSG